MQQPKPQLTLLQIAEQEHETYGGILLIDNGKPRVCFNCDKRAPCKCRPPGHIESLAPSYSEAAPENYTKAPSEPVAQQSLFHDRTGH